MSTDVESLSVSKIVTFWSPVSVAAVVEIIFAIIVSSASCVTSSVPLSSTLLEVLPVAIWIETFDFCTELLSYRTLTSWSESALL